MSRMTVKTFYLLILLVLLALVSDAGGQTLSNGLGSAGEVSPGQPTLLTDPAAYIDEAATPERLSGTLEILLLMTVLSLAPAILVMTTCFTRIVVVLALLRQAMATQQLPPAQVITGLALFMSLAVMAPTWSRINADAIQPYVNPDEGKEPITFDEAWGRARTHMRHFMITQIENTGNSEDVYMFMEFNSPSWAVQEKIREGTLLWEDVTMTALVPAFITSELKQAFIMGFYIYLPFLINDMVIASILMSMGMMMLPPILISLPFKLLLFVLVDGWHLVVGSLLQSFTNNPPI